MTLRMVRCRSVSDESTECNRPSEPAEVSLLSLMAMNVAASRPQIKHVFDWRVAAPCGRRTGLENSTNHKGVTPERIGYLCSMSAVMTDELCRWCGLAFCSCDTLRSNVRVSNTRATIVEHTSEE